MRDLACLKGGRAGNRNGAWELAKAWILRLQSLRMVTMWQTLQVPGGWILSLTCPWKLGLPKIIRPLRTGPALSAA